MGKYQNEIKVINSVKDEIWVTEDNKAETKRLAYSIDKKLKVVTFFPKKDDFFLTKITLDGFDKVPDEFSKNGYIKQGVQYYLNKKLESKGINELVLTSNGKSETKKIKNKLTLKLSYEDFKNLKSKFTNINQESGRQKGHVTDEFLFRLYPKHFAESKESSKEQYSRVVKNLDSGIIEHLNPTDLQKFEKFIIDLLEKKYDSKQHRFLQLTRTKLDIDSVAIDRILKEFQENLKKKVNEKKWGDFLLKNLFLIESKYVKVLRELIVILGIGRKVDFGMIDTKGYLDIYEIKTPETGLLSKKTDRGNYFWSTDATKAIVQAEKYLHNAERQAPSLSESLTRENRVKISVIKPQAFLIIGHSRQLDSDEKKEDFRILRNSLKNIRIILYDELLEGLDNQKNKYYDQISNVD